MAVAACTACASLCGVILFDGKRQHASSSTEGDLDCWRAGARAPARRPACRGAAGALPGTGQALSESGIDHGTWDLKSFRSDLDCWRAGARAPARRPACRGAAGALPGTGQALSESGIDHGTWDVKSFGPGPVRYIDPGIIYDSQSRRGGD